MRASLLLLACIAVGCASSGPAQTPEADEGGLIPEESDVLLLYSRTPPARLFELTYELLLSNGYEVSQSRPEFGFLATDGKPIGEGVVLRVEAAIEEEGGFSVLAVAGAWLPEEEVPSEETGTPGQPPVDAAWRPVQTGPTGRSAYAFEQMQALVETLPHERLERITE